MQIGSPVRIPSCIQVVKPTPDLASSSRIVIDDAHTLAGFRCGDSRDDSAGTRANHDDVKRIRHPVTTFIAGLQRIWQVR